MEGANSGDGIRSSSVTESLPTGKSNPPEGRTGESKVTHAEVTQSLLPDQLPSQLSTNSFSDITSVQAIDLDPEASLEKQLQSMIASSGPEDSLRFTSTGINGAVAGSDSLPPESDSDDDQLFHSASSTPFEDREDEIQSLLEQCAVASMMPAKSAVPEASLSTQTSKAWSDFQQALQQGDSPDVSAEQHLLNTLKLYPAVTNPEKIAAFLLRQTADTSPDRAVQLCKGFLDKFQMAEEMMPETLSSREPGIISDQAAIQILMIMHHKALSEGESTENIEEALQQRLRYICGGQVAYELGLELDEKNPDFDHFSWLSETLGSVDLKHRISQKVLGLAAKKPGGELSELIKLDSWLASDQTQENIVIRVLSEAFEKSMKEKGKSVGLYEEPPIIDAESTRSVTSDLGGTPTNKKKQRRVRFSSEPGVIPRDANKEGAQAAINDLVPLEGREKASHLTREYVVPLSEYLRKIEGRVLQAIDATKQQKTPLPRIDKKTHQFLVHRRGLAKQYLNSPKKQHRDQLLGSFDKVLDHIQKQPVGNSVDKRTQWVLNHPSVKAGLVSGADLLDGYEDHLALMIAKTVGISRSKQSPQKPLFKLVEPKDRPNPTETTKGGHPIPVQMQPTGEVKRRAPSTADIMRAIDPVTRVFDQAMELDISTPVEFCKSLIEVQDPRIMLTLFVRLHKEGKDASYIPNWEKRMKEVMCQVQAEQVAGFIDSQVKKDTAVAYGQNTKEYTEAADDYMIERTTAHINKVVKEVQQGGMRKPGITDFKNDRYQSTWDIIIKPQDFPKNVNHVLNCYMPSPEELLDRLASMGVVSKVSDGEGVFTWIANAVTAWFGKK